MHVHAFAFSIPVHNKVVYFLREVFPRNVFLIQVPGLIVRYIRSELGRCLSSILLCSWLGVENCFGLTWESKRCMSEDIRIIFYLFNLPTLHRQTTLVYDVMVGCTSIFNFLGVNPLWRQQFSANQPKDIKLHHTRLKPHYTNKKLFIL